MTLEFKKGLFRTSIIYISGFILMMIVHWIVGWDYQHAPPASFLVIVPFIFYAPIKTVNSISKIMSKNNEHYNKGSLIVHAAVTAFFIISFLYLRFSV